MSSFSTGPPVRIVARICETLNPEPGHGVSVIPVETSIPYGIYMNTTIIGPGQSVQGR